MDQFPKTMEEKPLGSANQQTKTIEEFLSYLRSKILYVIAAVLVCAALAACYVYIIATPLYESTAQIYVVSSKDSVLNLSDLQIGSYLTSDYQLVFKTWEVNEKVISDLNLPYSVAELKKMTTVTNPSNTRALQITVQSKDAAEAAAIANKYAEVAMDYISSIMQTERPTLLSEAIQALEPAGPDKKLIICVSALAGFALATWILFVLYLKDDRIVDSQDIERMTGMTPLAVIPMTEHLESVKGNDRRGRSTAKKL